MAILALSLLTSGCGVKLAYNNADRLARWWVSDYIDMTRDQRDYFDASTSEIMFWHRTTQLAIYRQGLLGIPMLGAGRFLCGSGRKNSGGSARTSCRHGLPLTQLLLAGLRQAGRLHSSPVG